jgi:hypothetical protein
MKAAQVMALAVNKHITKYMEVTKNTNTKMLKTDGHEYEKVKELK